MLNFSAIVGSVLQKVFVFVCGESTSTTFEVNSPDSEAAAAY